MDWPDSYSYMIIHVHFQGRLGRVGPNPYIRGDMFQDLDWSKDFIKTIWFHATQFFFYVNLKATLQFPCSVHFMQGLFAAANIFSSLKLVYIFSVNPYLGPLQVLQLSSINILAINHHSIKAINLLYLSINKLINPKNKSTIKSNEKSK